MPRDKSTEREDIGWRFAESIDGSRHKLSCRLCGKIITGGITRLKQHLAHQKGQVSGCPNVTTEIRTEMMRHLISVQEKKKDKRKQTEEVEAQIRACRQQYGDDYDYGGIFISSDDSDPELTWARRESARQQYEREE